MPVMPGYASAEIPHEKDRASALAGLALWLLKRTHKRRQAARRDHEVHRLTMGRRAGIHRHRVASEALRAYPAQHRPGLHGLRQSSR